MLVYKKNVQLMVEPFIFNFKNPTSQAHIRTLEHYMYGFQGGS